jgi:hypothetical protein
MGVGKWVGKREMRFVSWCYVVNCCCCYPNKIAIFLPVYVAFLPPFGLLWVWIVFLFFAYFCPFLNACFWLGNGRSGAEEGEGRREDGRGRSEEGVEGSKERV